MDIEQQVREAIVAELKRQAEADNGRVRVGDVDGDDLSLEGRINLEDLAMAVVGSVAGGP